MKDKKILFLILFALLLLFLILHLSRTVNIETARLKKTAEPLRSNAIRLESQVSQLQDLLHGFVQLNLVMKNNLEAEKNQNVGLKNMLDEISRQKEALSGQLAQAGTSLELTEGIRKKLSEMEQSLSSLKLEPGREKEFKNQLWELNRGLDKINYQIPELIRENKNYRREAEELKQALDKKEKELSSLKSGSREEKNRLQGLNQDILKLSQEIKSLKEAKGSLEATAAQEEKLRAELKTAHSNLGEELNRVKKDLAESRGKISQALKETETLQKQKESYIERIRSLEAAESEIAPLKKQIEELKEERYALTQELEAVKSGQLSAQKLQEELTKAQGQFGQLSAEHESLKSKARSDEETLKQNSLELGRRADRIVTLTDQMNALEAQSNETKLKFQGLEKDGALLRQENVSLRLEKESLNSQLGHLNSRLNEMETQASQISAILSQKAMVRLPIAAAIKNAGAAAKQPQPAENKRIEVEVLQETANENKQ